MKKAAIKFIILCAITLIPFSPARATHILGGEITWQCLPAGPDQGKLIFTMKLYRACYVGAAGLPNTTSLSNPLYQNYGGPSQIHMPLKSRREISLPCYDPNLQVQCGLSLANGGDGTFEELVYASEPTHLVGIPNVNGSEFTWSSCCRPTLKNATGANYFFSAAMFPVVDQNTNQDLHVGTPSTPTCYESSPVFAAPPASMVCAGRTNHYQHYAYDIDGDSLSFQWQSPRETSTSNVTFLPGYTPGLQLPTSFHDSRNVDPVMDPITGLITFTPFIPVGGYHSISVAVTAYKNGKPTSRIARDIVVTIYDCDSAAGSLNPNPPTIEYKEASATAFSPSFNGVYAPGDIIDLTIKGSDFDSLPTLPKAVQSISLSVYGTALSGRPNDITNCLSPPCAFLDTILNPDWLPGLEIHKDSGEVFANFRWNTSCLNMRDLYGMTGASGSKTFKFLVRAYDNWCPVPNEVSSVFQITLTDPNFVQLSFAEMDASTGGCQLTWSPVASAAYPFQLIRYDVYPGSSANVVPVPNASFNTFDDSLAPTDSISVIYEMNSGTGSTCASSYLLRTIHLKKDTTFGNPLLLWNPPYFTPTLSGHGFYVVFRKENAAWTVLDTVPFGTNSYTDIQWNDVNSSYKIESNDIFSLHSVSNIVEVDGSNVGIADINDQPTSFRIYPNPFAGKINLQRLNVEENTSATVVVYSLTGQQVYQETINSDQVVIDLGFLDAGTFVLKYTDHNGLQKTHKIVHLK